jgi:hypothetical protein
MVATYGFGMVHDNMGLMNVVTSYVGKVAVTATADREMMPDPAFYAQCLERSFDQLKAAAAGAQPDSRPSVSRRRGSRPRG